MTSQMIDTPTVRTDPAKETYSPPEDKQQLAEVLNFMHAARTAGRDLHEPQYFLSGTEPGQQIPLPREVYLALEQVVTAMRQGLAVAVVPADKSVTTQEAADLLGISRPTVVKLIQQAVLPHEMVGTHRRVPLDAVLAYRRQRRDAQYAALAELASDEDPEPAEIIERVRRARKRVAQRH